VVALIWSPSTRYVARIRQNRSRRGAGVNASPSRSEAGLGVARGGNASVGLAVKAKSHRRGALPSEGKRAPAARRLPRQCPTRSASRKTSTVAPASAVICQGRGRSDGDAIARATRVIGQKPVIEARQRPLARQTVIVSPADAASRFPPHLGFGGEHMAPIGEHCEVKVKRPGRSRPPRWLRPRTHRRRTPQRSNPPQRLIVRSAFCNRR